MSDKTERVQVKMSSECKAVLKNFAETYGMTLDQVLYGCTRRNFHRQAAFCDIMTSKLDVHGIKPEGGHDKPCYGFLCNNCQKETACRARVYDGVIDFKEKLRRFVRPNGIAVIHEMQRSAGQPCQAFPQQLKQNVVVKTTGIALAPSPEAGQRA